MRNAPLWRALLGVEKAVIEPLEYEVEQVLVAAVRPTRKGLDTVRPPPPSLTRGTTGERAGGFAGRWIWGRSRSTSRRTRYG